MEVSEYKKIAAIFLLSAAACVVWLLILVLLAPRLIDFDRVKSRVVAALAERSGERFSCRSLRLSLWPRVQLDLVGVRWLAGANAGATAQSVDLQPKVMPLLAGELRIAKVEIRTPVVFVELPAGSWEREEAAAAVLAGIAGRLFPMVRDAASAAADLVVVWADGRARLTRGNETVFRLEGLEGRLALPGDELTLTARGKSDFWEEGQLSGKVNSRSFESNGQVELRGIKTAKVVNSLFSGLVEEGAGASARLDVAALRSDFHLNANKFEISVSELRLEELALDLTGRLSVSYKEEQPAYKEEQAVGVTLFGRDVALSSAREAALSLGGHSAVVHGVFDVLREGMASNVTWQSRAGSLKDLWRMENATLSGSLRDATISVPARDFVLTHAKGDLSIAGGILEGTALEAAVGNSRASEGRLKLDLLNGDGPLYLDATIRADLSELPEVLTRLTESGSFRAELARIKELQGAAMGRLVLEDKEGVTRPRVDVSKLNLSARYERIPVPVEVMEGQCSYQDGRFAAKALKGNLGGIRFSELSGAVGTTKGGLLEIESGRLNMPLGEVSVWSGMIDADRGGLKNLAAAQGDLVVSRLRVTGPLLDPGQWRFDVGGGARNVTIGPLDPPGLPGPIKVKEAAFDAVPGKVTASASGIAFLDAVLDGQGALTGSRQEIQSGDLTFGGELGPEATKWIWRTQALPPQFLIQSPIILKTARLAWSRAGSKAGSKVGSEGTETTFSSDFGMEPHGLNASVRLVADKEHFQIEALTVEDDRSQALGRFLKTGDELSFDYSGHLYKSTVDHLFAENPFLQGELQGDFSATFTPGASPRLWTQGRISGRQLVLPLRLPREGVNPSPTSEIAPAGLTLERFAFGGDERGVKIETAVFMLGENQGAADGAVKTTKEGLVVDLNLKTALFNWDLVRTIFLRDKKGDDSGGSAGKASALPLRGTIRMDAQRLKFERFVWSPCRLALSFRDDGVVASITEANLCGISTPGVVGLSEGRTDLDLKLLSEGAPVDSAIACLWNREGVMTGRFDLNGKLEGEGKPGDILGSLHGSAQFAAAQGRIYRLGLLAKIFSLINVTEVLRGKKLDLTEEGFAFANARAKAELKDGKLTLTEGDIEGSSMEILFEGDIDLLEEKMDLKVLVAPFKTVDFIVKKLPVITDILGGNLVTIPVHVTGGLADPAVLPLAPSAVGSSLLDMLKRTFLLPGKLVKPRKEPPEIEETQPSQIEETQP